MKRFILAALITFLASSAEARVRLAHPDCNVLWPCQDVAPSPRGEQVVKAMGGFGSAQKVYTPRITAHRVRVANVNYKAPVRSHEKRPHRPTHVEIATQAAPVQSSSLSRPLRYITGRLICAVNVNAALAERGIKGTGSALAKSFLSWGRSAGGPVPGAVIVSNRRGGGHVAIVSRVQNGVVYAWNATGGQSGWREIPYRHAVIDYRVPG